MKADIPKLSYHTPIEIKVLKKNFATDDGFTKLYKHEFDFIMNSADVAHKEGLLAVYLFMKSHMKEGFWRGINSYRTV